MIACRLHGNGWVGPPQQLPVAFVAVGEEDDEPFWEQRTSGNQTSYMNRREGEVLTDTLGALLSGGHLQSKDIGQSPSHQEGRAPP